MSAECYYGECRHHSVNYDPYSGPFCDEPYCRASPQELEKFGEQRVIYLKQLYGDTHPTNGS